MPPDSLHGYGRVTASTDSAGRRLDVASRDGFWARLDSRNGAAYGWTERLWSGGGTWTTPVGGRSGTTAVNPAYDLNGGVTATPGTVVWMYPGAWGGNTAGQEYLFSSCCVGRGSGSGSGDGLGGPVLTTCCENTIPGRLYGTISAMGCSRWNGVSAAMNYSDGSWSGCFQSTDNAYVLAIGMMCEGISGTCTGLSIFGATYCPGTFVNCGNGGNIPTPSVFIDPVGAEVGCTCSPFSAVFLTSLDDVLGTCGCTAPSESFTLTVTE